jgi:hypothetical protein
VLATESTEKVIKLKIATALVCLIWRELNGQNHQLCQEVKEECFALVAGQSVKKLLGGCACHVKEVLTSGGPRILVKGMPHNFFGLGIKNDVF